MYIRSPEEDTSWTTYTNPFAWDQWSALVLFTLINAVLVRSIYAAGRKMLGVDYDRGGATYSSMSDAMFLSLSTLVQQGGLTVPRDI